MLQRTLHGQLECSCGLSGIVFNVAREVGAIVFTTELYVNWCRCCTELDGRRYQRHTAAQPSSVAIPRDVRNWISARRLARQPDVLRLSWVTWQRVSRYGRCTRFHCDT